MVNSGGAKKLTNFPRKEFLFASFGVFRGLSESELPVECFDDVPKN